MQVRYLFKCPSSGIPGTRFPISMCPIRVAASPKGHQKINALESESWALMIIQLES